MKAYYDKLEGRLQAEGFKLRVLRIFKAWEDTIFPPDFMNKMHNIFMGVKEVNNFFMVLLLAIDDCLILKEEKEEPVPDTSMNIDGAPIDHESDEELPPMDGAAILKNVMKQYRSPSPEPDMDIDGTIDF